MFFVRASHLPKDLTSYDLLKSLAVILMVLDHVGSYFYSDDMWWRAAATSAPLWFFFVGYAKGRNLNPPIWTGAFLLFLACFIVGKSIFPLNILFAIIITRLVLDNVMAVFFKSKSDMFFVIVVMAILAIPSWVAWEYGTIGIMAAMWAWMLRHQDEDPLIKETLPWFGVVTIMGFIGMHLIAFDFSSLQTYMFAISTVIAFALAYFFKVKTYPDLTAKLPNIMVSALQIMGRYSLYLYVGHVLLFMVMGLWLNPEKFSLFEWAWVK